MSVTFCGAAALMYPTARTGTYFGTVQNCSLSFDTFLIFYDEGNSASKRKYQTVMWYA